MKENSTRVKYVLSYFKLVLASLIIISGCIVTQTTVSADEAYGDYTYDYADSKTSIEITKYNGSEANVEIPSQINGLPVKYILAGAFANNRTIVSVVIPETVTQIGNSWNTGVFSNCARLEKVTIKSGSDNAYIGNGTFYNCPSLTSIEIPSNYVTIYDSAFKDCTKLREVKWEKSSSDFANQVISNSSFAGCKALKSISLPGNLKSIGSFAFQNCSLLTSITIPEGTEVIDVGAFQNCSSLATASIPSTIKEIGNSWNTGAFADCVRLSNVTIAEGTEDAYIGNATFYNCSSLTTINIPANYLTIYDGAFKYCSKLKKVVYNKTTYDFPNQVIGSSAFYGCKSLEEISLSTSLKTIKSYAFQDCILLKQINIPEGVTLIDVGAFANNTSLKSASLPSTIIEIGNSWNTGAFYNCTSLTSVSMKAGTEDAYIGNSTFQNCIKLEEITIPGNYLTIYSNAFKDCTKLSSITYKASSYEFASQVIDSGAFSNCKSLSKISLPETLKSIGSYAFSNCSGLKKLEIKEGLETIDVGAFQSNTALVTVTLPSTLTVLGNSWNTGVFSDCNKLKTVTMPTGEYELYIGNNTFRNCSSLTSVFVGENVKIDSETSAFYNCNRKAKVYTKSQTAIGLAKAGGLKTSSPSSSYVNGKSLFGSAAISGVAKINSKLTASTLAIAPINASVSYKWTIDGKVVSTKNTFTVRKSDKGKKITLTITGKDGFKGSLTTTVTVAK